MKEGAWIEAGTGRWHWIDDHADWIRRPACARLAGLPEEAVFRIAAMARKQWSGAERTAILFEAMKYGLIRFRGHGAEVTFETTMPLGTAIHAVAPFMAEQFGPRTMVRFNQLPDGPCIGVTYKDLILAIEAGDLTHREFLADGRSAPQEDFSVSLLEALGTGGSICVYSSYEKRILTELVQSKPRL